MSNWASENEAQRGNQKELLSGEHQLKRPQRSPGYWWLLVLIIPELALLLHSRPILWTSYTTSPCEWSTGNPNSTCTKLNLQLIIAPPKKYLVIYTRYFMLVIDTRDWNLILPSPPSFHPQPPRSTVHHVAWDVPPKSLSYPCFPAPTLPKSSPKPCLNYDTTVDSHFNLSTTQCLLHTPITAIFPKQMATSVGFLHSSDHPSA